LSVLRSPAIPTYLHEPEYYTMTEWDGMRDAGEHAFEFAITAYSEAFSKSNVVIDSEGYNAGLVPLAGMLDPVTLPALSSGCCRLSAMKWAEKGRALVLRLVEYRGQGGEARLSLPQGVSGVERTNLLERQGKPLGDRHIAPGFLRDWLV
jgi:alpha-mannosidase